MPQIEILSFLLWLDQCCILEEHDATLTPILCAYYLRERGRKECFTQACYASPSKKAGMMEAQFQHRLQHEARVPPSALISVSYPCGKVLMRKHIILSVYMHNLLHLTPYVWLLEHMRYNECVCFLSIYSMTVKI